MIELRDIRFSMGAGERLVVRGFIERKDIINAENGKIVIHQIPESIAKRISDYCDFEISDYLNNWIPVNSGNYTIIERVYADKNEPAIVEAKPVVEEVAPEVKEPVVEEPVKAEEPVVEEKIEKVVVPEEKHEEAVEEVSNVVVEKPISLMDIVKDIDLSNAPEAHFEEAIEEKVEEVVPEEKQEKIAEKKVVEETAKEGEPTLKSVNYQQNKQQPVHINKKKHH